MSFNLDNQDAVNTNSFATPPPKKGGSLKWILGGCGCLGLVMVLCVGGVVGLGVFAASKATAVVQEAQSFVENSTVAQQHLGNPIVIDEVRPVSDSGQTLRIEFDVTGPKGDGTVTVNAVLDKESFDFVIGESTLEVNGEVFDLNRQDEFKMDLEGMDEDF